MYTQTVDKQLYYDIYRCVRALAGADDHARSQDGVGFNKMDTDFGQSLASRPWENWTYKQIYYAWKMCRRYQAQLMNVHHIDFVSIPVPISPDELNQVVATSDVEGVALPPQKAIRLPSHFQQPLDQAPIIVPAESRATVKDISIDTANDIIVIKFSNLPSTEWNAIYQAVNAIPGRRFNGDLKQWEAPFVQTTAQAVVDVAKIHGFGATQETITAILAKAKEGRKVEEASHEVTADIEIDGLGGVLRPFQKAAVRFSLLTGGRTLIADEMGLGKTIEAIATLQAFQAFPALVVCPASLKINWERECLKWLPGKVIFRVASVVDYDELRDVQPDIVIINYDNLYKNIAPLVRAPFQAVIFDEAHRLKNKKAQRSEAALRITYKIPADESLPQYRKFDQSKAVPRRLLLTGTPVLNRPMELLHPLEILGRVQDIAPRGVSYFKNRYCGQWDGYAYRGAGNTEELHSLLRKSCYIRRTKEDVFTELPAEINTVIPFEIDSKTKKEYDKAFDDVITWVGEQEVLRAHKDAEFMQSISGLSPEQQQDAINARRGDAEDKAARAEQLVRIGKLKQLAAKGKLHAVIPWIKDFLESGEKLVVFAYHISVQEAVVAAFPGCANIHDPKERQANVDRFQNDPNCNLMVSSLKAGGEGLDLSAASNVAFIELGWTPGEHDQAFARAGAARQMFASTGVKSVNSWYLIASNTIDEQIATLIDGKRNVVKAITDGKEMAESESIMEELWKYMASEAKKRKSSTSL